MIRHCVMFQWKPGTPEDHIAGFEAALGRLGTSLPGIVTYRFGRDIGVNQGNCDFTVSADFHTLDDYIRYRDDVFHKQIIAEFITDHIEGRAAGQIEIP